ncbi:SusC/RagA family TonB-linked outer membrane protein [Sphingobacterium hotanense]|uniref:SusC/RagA family TonB-linked outer membrane protein n=1 Tax=Sphingobacterium hotanense TaxID=649196 RepID=UPI0021A75CF8|nr:SusC/RagA family TonB-linked outer membrane protein [Sphingobacterium hotanense]MCT1523350.1 SusC/RagA family TonB-linked outer membrane protein [Sphingobacterium hotanense]
MCKSKLGRYFSFVLSMLFVFTTSMSMAQTDRVIRGTVVDATTGAALGGVSISDSATKNATSTANDGTFEIGTRTNSTLIFQYVGYARKTVTVGAESNIRVQLSEDESELEEVVVVAYGTARKRDLTGAVSQIDSKALTQQSNSTVSRALEGAAPGIQVSAVDGQPGVDMGIRVRGLGSANQNTSNALVVIDGVPAQNDNPLASISPKDIESVTILKDAASTALYGSRGANGVVLITTKKGVKGTPRIAFESKLGMNQIGPYQYDKISDPKDIYEFAWLSIYNSVRYGVDGSGTAKGYTTNVQNPNMSHEEAALFASQHLFDYTGSTTDFKVNNLGNWMLYDVPGAIYTPTGGTGANASSTMTGAYLVNTDGKLNPNARLLYNENYDSHLLQNRTRQEYNVSASGGSDKIDYFISGGYLGDPSYIRGSSFKRYNGRANVNAQVYDWLKLGANVGYANRDTQSPATRFGRNPGSSTANAFRFINGQNPLTQLFARDQNGNIIQENGKDKVHVLQGDTWSPVGPTTAALSSTNVLTVLDNDIDKRVSDDWNTRVYGTINFLNDFTFTANFSLDKFNDIRTRYWNSESGQAAGIGAFGKVFSNVSIMNAQQLLNYNKTIGSHTIEGLLGHEYDAFQFETLNYRSSYSLIDNFPTYANYVGRYDGGTFSNPGGGTDTRRMESYFARGNYNYADKYFAQVSVRRDGSSKFKLKDKRWGTFWSVGAGWRINGEDFMENTQGWLDNLKVRASYGVIGNQNGISNYSGYQTWGFSAVYQQTSGGTGIPTSYVLNQNAYVNDQLTWEKINTFDAGLEVGLFNRVRATFDYYNRLTTNAIWSQPIAMSKGQSSILTNSAKLSNYGFEVDLSVDVIKNEDWTWTVSTNGTHYRTILKEVPPGVGSAALDGDWTGGVDGWSSAGTAGNTNIAYLRGIDKDYFNMYLFKYAGVDQSTGLPMFYHRVTEADLSAGLFSGSQVGESVATTDYSKASRYEMGSAVPSWIGGFSTSLRYKNFDLYGAFAYQVGGKFLSTEYANSLYVTENPGKALSSELIGNTWTPENTGAKFPMVMYGNTYGNGSTFGSWMYSDMAMFNASYLNLKNITVGYTLPADLLGNSKIKRLRVYASGDNIFMLTSHSGIDPRMSLVGGWEVGAYSYPTMRTFSAGVNLEF